MKVTDGMVAIQKLEVQTSSGHVASKSTVDADKSPAQLKSILRRDGHELS